MGLGKALTIIAGENGVQKVIVHRDPDQEYSAEPGLALLGRLARLIQELDRVALGGSPRPAERAPTKSVVVNENP
jgi:hypothetical protein